MEENKLYHDFYEAVKQIPAGRVMNYGTVARLSGHPGAARAVGRALHRNPQPGVIPCHRVVMRDGSLAPAFAFGGPGAQQKLLESEGVEVRGGRVDMKRFGLVIE